MDERKGLKKWLFEHRYQLEDLRLMSKMMRDSLLAKLGLLLIGIFLFLAILGPLLAPYDPKDQNLDKRFLPPSTEHLFGTDQLGRDIFSRILYGSQISLVMGIVVTAILFLIGSSLGLVAGYFGGKVDEIIMRATDMFLAFPSLILAMAVAAALGPSLFNTMLTIAFVGWPRYARLARANCMQVKEETYIEAARAIGVSDRKIIFSHIMPMIISPMIVQATINLGGVILLAAGLGFLGLGAQPPAPEWGLMISEGRRFISSQWWVAGFPGIMILIVVLGFNLLGDSLRDILDVRLRR
ncbi:MAG: nickel transporter permease [Candidatus Bathyarchaeia archaeon]